MLSVPLTITLMMTGYSGSWAISALACSSCGVPRPSRGRRHDGSLPCWPGGLAYPHGPPHADEDKARSPRAFAPAGACTAGTGYVLLALIIRGLTDASGVHATVAGVAMGLLLRAARSGESELSVRPTARWRSGCRHTRWLLTCAPRPGRWRSPAPIQPERRPRRAAVPLRACLATRSPSTWVAGLPPLAGPRAVVS